MYYRGVQILPQKALPGVKLYMGPYLGRVDGGILSNQDLQLLHAKLHGLKLGGLLCLALALLRLALQHNVAVLRLLQLNAQLCHLQLLSLQLLRTWKHLFQRH